MINIGWKFLFWNQLLLSLPCSRAHWGLIHSHSEAVAASWKMMTDLHPVLLRLGARVHCLAVTVYLHSAFLSPKYLSFTWLEGGHFSQPWSAGTWGLECGSPQCITVLCEHLIPMKLQTEFQQAETRLTSLSLPLATRSSTAINKQALSWPLFCSTVLPPALCHSNALLQILWASLCQTESAHNVDTPGRVNEDLGLQLNWFSATFLKDL